jgi:hypothetical protein
MSGRSLEKQQLIKALGIAAGEVVFGLSGPFSFYWLGLNVPEGAAAGSLVGAAIGYGFADMLLRFRNRQRGVPRVPDITKPEVGTGVDDLYTAGAKGTGAPLGGVKADLTRRRIEEALGLDAQNDPEGIRVEVRNSKVVLHGRVHSWQQEAEAERIAFDMPGIQEVDNRLEVVR